MAVLFACGLYGTHIATISVRVSEDILYAFDPSHDRAFAYASRHFDAQHPWLYDIERAEFYLLEIAKSDPTYPYVYHQLARIAFLRGHFQLALQRVNMEIQNAALQDREQPNSYYVKGLILGYMGRYGEAARAYETYLLSDPENWAALNDYAWTLLKAGRAQDAVAILDPAMETYDRNPWLLNTYAIALYETGRPEDAYVAAQRAFATSYSITKEDWLAAYPGNDPEIAQEGIATLREAAEDNMHMIERAFAGAALQ